MFEQFPNLANALLLMLLGIASVFVCISLITTAVLQATFMFM